MPKFTVRVEEQATLATEVTIVAATRQEARDIAESMRMDGMIDLYFIECSVTTEILGEIEED